MRNVLTIFLAFLLTACDLLDRGLDRKLRLDDAQKIISSALNEVTPEQAALIRDYIPTTIEYAIIQNIATQTKSATDQIEGKSLREIIHSRLDENYKNVQEDLRKIDEIKKITVTVDTKVVGPILFSNNPSHLGVGETACTATLKISNNSNLEISDFSIEGYSTLENYQSKIIYSHRTYISQNQTLKPGQTIELADSCTLDRVNSEDLTELIEKNDIKTADIFNIPHLSTTDGRGPLSIAREEGLKEALNSINKTKEILMAK